MLGSTAAIDAAIGAFATVAPHSFYRHVLGVDLLGPYNSHLLSDVGGFYLSLGVLFTWAACTLGRELIQATCTAATLVAILHFTYHAAHLDRFSPGQAAAQTVALVVAVVLPILAFRMSRSGVR